MSQAKRTTDHQTIRRWVEERGGHPARVRGTGSDEDDPGILRIDFPGHPGGGKLEEIEWDAFFEAFEENRLAFLYRDEPASGGKSSRFSKLVRRDAGDEDSDEDRGED